MSGDPTTSQRTEDVGADPRRGWFAPTRPGPSRRAFAAVISITVVLLLSWLMISLDLPGSYDAVHDGRAVTRVLDVDDSARVRVGDARRVGAPKGYRGDRGTPYAVVKAELRMGNDIGRMRIDLDAPVGVDARDVALRARTPSAVVELHRTEDGDPWVSVERVRSGRLIVDVLVAMPSEGLSFDVPEDAPKLRDATHPYDDKVVDEAASGRRLRWLHQNAVWLSALVLLLGIAVPVLVAVLVRRRWYRSITVQAAATTPPTGPPKTMRALDAAVVTMGADGVDPADGFAGHVLELVARERVRLRHTKDPRTGEGSVFGIGAARAATASTDGGIDAAALAVVESPLDAAAIALLTAVANASGDTVQLPDATRLVADAVVHPSRSGDVDQARLAWRRALADAAAQLRIIERPRWVPIAIIAALTGLLAIVAAVLAVVAQLDGTRATAWYLVVLASGPAGILAMLARELRSWVRVARARTGDRRAWVAWREVLRGQASAGSTVDVRNLPFAAATGPVTGIAPRLAGPSSVGLAAATPATVDALRVLAGGRPIG